MGIIYNNNVEETKIYHGYGMTVYGKINRYVWTMHGNKEENALITIRIEDSNGNNLIDMNMGNRCIFQSRVNDTMDNFLYWMVKEKPDQYSIEKQIYKSLCQSDSLFNHSIIQKKNKQRREEEERKQIAEREKEEHAAIDSITAYSSVNDLFPCFTYDKVYLIKALTETARNVFKSADNKQIEGIIEFMEKYPDNKDARIVTSGSMEEVLRYIA